MSRLVDISPYEKCRIVLHKDDSGFPVKDLPTVDAVEVVRCKDCEKWDAFADGLDSAGYCYKWHDNVQSDGYCYYGEREEVSE